MERPEKRTWDNSTSMWWMRPENKGILFKRIIPKQTNHPSLDYEEKISAVDLLSNRFWHRVPSKIQPKKNHTSQQFHTPRAIIPKQTNHPSLDYEENISAVDLLSNRFWHRVPSKIQPKKNPTSQQFHTPHASKKKYEVKSTQFAVRGAIKNHNLAKKKTHNRAKPKKNETFSTIGGTVAKLYAPTAIQQNQSQLESGRKLLEPGRKVIHSQTRFIGISSEVKMLNGEYHVSINWENCTDATANSSFYPCRLIEDMGELVNSTRKRRKPDRFLPNEYS